MELQNVYLKTLLTYVSEKYKNDEVVVLLSNKINNNNDNLISAIETNINRKNSFRDIIKKSVEIVNFLEQRDKELTIKEFLQKGNETENKENVIFNESQNENSLKNNLIVTENQMDVLKLSLTEYQVEKLKLSLTEDQFSALINNINILKDNNLDLNIKN